MRIYLKARILPAFGKMPLDSIGPEDVAAWFDTASKDKPGAANRAFEIMRAMMFRAEEWGLRKRDSNPCLGIAKNPRNNIARFLDTDGLARLGRALDAREAEWPEAVAAIRLLAFTGCRRSEVLNLRCLDIGAKEISLPDGKTGPRTVPLGRAARAHIDALPGGMNPHGFLFPKYAEGRIQHILREGIVKLTDCRLFSAFLHEAKPLKLLRAAFDNFQDFGVNPVNLTKPADIIRLLLLTGCRRSEIVRLRWSEVDRDKLVLADSKTGPRTVPLNTQARRILERRPRGASPFVFPSPRDPARPRSRNLPFWYRARREAGIEEVRLHDLRHTHASHAVMNGIPVPVVSRLLGHSDVRTTLRYAHLGDREIEAAAERVGQSIAAVMGL